MHTKRCTYFDKNINGMEIGMRKFWIVIIVSCVTLGEFYFSINFKYKLLKPLQFALEWNHFILEEAKV